MQQQQRGMTLIGMVLTLATVVIIGVVVIKVVPVYIGQFSVESSLKALNAIPSTEFSSDPAANAGILKSKLLSQLYVNSIESITPQQINVIPNPKGNFDVSVKYQVIRPLVANVSLLFDFEASQEVHVSE